MTEQLWKGVMEVYLLLATDRLGEPVIIWELGQGARAFHKVFIHPWRLYQGANSVPSCDFLFTSSHAADKRILKWLLHDKHQHPCPLSPHWLIFKSSNLFHSAQENMAVCFPPEVQNVFHCEHWEKNKNLVEMILTLKANLHPNKSIHAASVLMMLKQSVKIKIDVFSTNNTRYDFKY